MDFKIGFGKGYRNFTIADGNLLAVLNQNKVETIYTGIDEVKRALENPIGSKKLSKLVKENQKIVIITSDITRPMPTKEILPFILMELYQAGVKDSNITIVFALGSHRKHTSEEMKMLVGDEIYNRINCVDSNSSDCIRCGITSRGTPVDVFKTVAEADFRICLGNIEFHYFAGYSGGAKAIMPGVSNREAIQANHSAMVNPLARAGAIDDNPVRLDIDEIAKFISVDFIFNVVLDEDKHIIKAIAGHYIKAHREGCLFLDSLYKITIPRKADIVITTPGGFPKDINLYQAQKALDNAKHAVRNGGIIILLASCSEGLGEDVFERWMLENDDPVEIINKIQVNFELGGHKAAAIAMVDQISKIYLVSDLEDTFVEKLFMKPFCSVNEAIENAVNILGKESSIILMPHGGSTLPVVID